MPIYEYECKKCGDVFSVLKLGSTSVDTSCPKCGSSDTGKKISSFCSPAGNSFSGGDGGSVGGGFGGG